LSLKKVVSPLKKGIYAFLTTQKAWIHPDGHKPVFAGMTRSFFRDFLQLPYETTRRRLDPYADRADRFQPRPLCNEIFIGDEF
jgi:hypothetical protein